MMSLKFNTDHEFHYLLKCSKRNIYNILTAIFEQTYNSLINKQEKIKLQTNTQKTSH